jgi:hypothetical protein
MANALEDNDGKPSIASRGPDQAGDRTPPLSAFRLGDRALCPRTVVGVLECYGRASPVKRGVLQARSHLISICPSWTELHGFRFASNNHYCHKACCGLPS